jgi:beta-RFAP synthase
MIDAPTLVIEATKTSATGDDRFTASGPLASRAIEVARRAADRLSFQPDQGAKFNIVAAPRQHVGLGSGTQLGLAVTTALAAIHGSELPRSAEALASASGRGERSSVGTHGFLHGGLIVEAGKHEEDAIGPLIARVDLPTDWRFLLLIPAQTQEGLSGSTEREAFAHLPPVPKAITDALCRETLLEMIPAAQAGDCDRFGDSVFRFGELAGSCFAAQQGGSYASPALAELVASLRRREVHGVGQSSWGPALFALLPNETAAERLRADLDTELPGEFEFVVAAPQNEGARRVVGK